MDMSKEQQDIMDAKAILEELDKLIESERSENEPGTEQDVRELEEAKAHLQAFVAAEEKEEVGEKTEAPAEKAEVIDTGVLTGPIGGLKSFLMKKQQEKA